MIQIDLPVAFTVGQIFALASKDYLKKCKNKYANKVLGPLNLYLSCGFAPAVIYFSVGWPSWETMYKVSWVETTFNKPLIAASYSLFLISLILIGNFSFILAHHFYLKNRDYYVKALILIGLVLIAIPLVDHWPVWLKIGTYSQIHNNEGYLLWQNPFCAGCIIAVSYFLLTTIYTLKRLLKLCKKTK